MDPIAEANEKVKALRVERLRELLEDCAEFLEDYEDVRDGDDGRQEPNAAMSLRMRILAELA